MPFRQGTYGTELKYDVNSSFKVINDMMEKYMKRAVKWKEKHEKVNETNTNECIVVYIKRE